VTLFNVPADIAGTITPGRRSGGITITTPGQNARLMFSGTTGQKVSLQLNGVTISTSYVSINNPDGTTLLSPSGVSTSGKLIEPLTLPANGTYTILEDPSGSSTGGATLTLYTVVDISGTITPGGSPVTATITAPGQKRPIHFRRNSGTTP